MSTQAQLFSVFLARWTQVRNSPDWCGRWWGSRLNVFEGVSHTSPYSSNHNLFISRIDGAVLGDTSRVSSRARADEWPVIFMCTSNHPHFAIKWIWLQHMLASFTYILSGGDAKYMDKHTSPLAALRFGRLLKWVVPFWPRDHLIYHRKIGLLQSRDDVWMFSLDAHINIINMCEGAAYATRSLNI